MRANKSRNAKMVIMVLLLLVVTMGRALGQTTLLPAGSLWRYLHYGSDQGTTWQGTTFDDSSWNSGSGQLGYGDGDEATVVSFGPSSGSKYVTTYFRTSFEVADASLFSYLQLRLLRDDGAVVYLNGAEIQRSNMPASAIGYLTLAASTVGGVDEDTFFEYLIDASDLVSGTNVVAVEIHQRSLTSSDISFDLEVRGTDSVDLAFRKAPYLIYPGDNTAMQVQWQLLVTAPCLIEWGLDESYGLGSLVTQEYGSDHQHSFTMSGLTPATTYFYHVVAGQDTVSASFSTAPADDAADVSFLAYGDTRTYPEGHDQVSAGIMSALTNDPALHSLLLSVGDLVADGNQEDDWDSQFFDPAYTNIQAMLASLPYQSCRGNHEGSAALFSKYFPYPFTAPYYWSFDYGPAHFVVVDQYVSYAPGSVQYNWIDADLAGTTKPWKFMVIHEPGWTAGGHGNNVNVQNYLQPLCLEHDVPIVFAGHNHYYARAVVDSVQHVTTGGGGAPLYAPDPGYPGIVTVAQVHHFCTIGIKGNTLTFTAISAAGDTIDGFTVTKPLSPVDNRDHGLTPRKVILGDAFPNPFNPSTTIAFSVKESSSVKLEVIGLDGGVVETLAEGVFLPGEYRATWKGTNTNGQRVSSGVYLYRLDVGGSVQGKKMVMIK